MVDSLHFVFITLATCQTVVGCGVGDGAPPGSLRLHVASCCYTHRVRQRLSEKSRTRGGMCKYVCVSVGQSSTSFISTIYVCSMRAKAKSVKAGGSTSQHQSGFINEVGGSGEGWVSHTSIPKSSRISFGATKM